MKHLIERLWREDDGVLSFEWVLLVTLLTIGVVAGIAGARDAIIDELGDVAEAAICIDQSYSIAPFVSIDPPFEAAGSEFIDTKADFTACDRATDPIGQGPLFDI